MFAWDYPLWSILQNYLSICFLFYLNWTYLLTINSVCSMKMHFYKKKNFFRSKISHEIVSNHMQYASCFSPMLNRCQKKFMIFTSCSLIKIVWTADKYEANEYRMHKTLQKILTKYEKIIYFRMPKIRKMNEWKYSAIIYLNYIQAQKNDGIFIHVNVIKTGWSVTTRFRL